MSRQVVVRVVIAGCLILVAGVLGLAAKVGQDTSQYLQSVSTQRNWASPGSESVGGVGGAQRAESVQGAAAPSGELVGTDGVVASR